MTASVADKHASIESGRLPAVRGGDVIEEIHLSRYRFAASYTGGKRVLDIACGIGYGSYLLAGEGKAKHVDGADISKEAIEAAKDRYPAPTLSYHHVDGGRLPFADSSFDVVVSFETIEHVESPAAFLGELRRVLVQGGRLIISTPNRRFHSMGRRTPWNPFHEVEYSPAEFRKILMDEFPSVEFWGGQEFIGPGLRLLVKYNWTEFRYYQITKLPGAQSLRAGLRAIKHRIAGKGSSDPARTGGQDPVTVGRRSNIVPWVAGMEPYTMVAVCLKLT
jgi:SAM-dependent methyltransferase